MNAPQTVCADEVVVGDSIYNNHEKEPAFRWSRVVEARLSNCGRFVVLVTPGYETWKHPKEAVVVTRGFV